MIRRSLSAFLALALLATSCKKTDMGGNAHTADNPIAPDNFNFSTSREVALNVRLLTNDDMPLSGVVVNVSAAGYSDNILYTAITDENGSIAAKMNIASYIDTLVVDPAYIGLMRHAKTVINGNKSTCLIGGSQGYGGDVVVTSDAAGGVKRDKTMVAYGGNASPNFFYFTAYDVAGRPTERAASDKISSSLLLTINNALPEYKPVPIYHPEYLSSTINTGIDVVKTGDVWITFVSEGAGYLNSLGFYTYSTGNPPKTVSDIKKINILFPNASLLGSGGTMVSGDKLYLGRFSAGTSIGYVLLQNAWSSSQQKVNDNAKLYFADDNLNAEVEAVGFRRHTVMLWDDASDVFIQGFEDLQRDNKSSDDDFNDLVFYTTGSTIETISQKNVLVAAPVSDSDGDGVIDENDQFPYDATRAYIQYFPSKTMWGTLAFEDMWPSTGDYDLNDLVVGYQYRYIKNAANGIVEMYADYNIRAVGASFTNGFGVELPFASSAVSSVTGQRLIANYIKQNNNSTEAGQSKAVIIPFDDTRALFPSGGFTNVYTGRTKQTSDTARLYVKFTKVMAEADMGMAPYNPFLISSQRRGYEVHLPGTTPTSLANTALFGTADDNTMVSKSRYYLNANNWPWALSFTENFDYPSESNNIASAYLFFLTWAKSGGTLNTDWYKHTSANVNESYIFK